MYVAVVFLGGKSMLLHPHSLIWKLVEVSLLMRRSGGVFIERHKSSYG